MEANRRILIVDDQDDLRQQVARMLRQQGGHSDTTSLIDQIRSRISKSAEAVTSPTGTSYEVDTVSQGKDAYEKVRDSFSRHEPYAVMFLDMRMPPGWDGLETAQRVRSIDKEIQIVIMTAYADYEQQEVAEQVGEPDKLLYIKKPFHSEEIRQLALAMTEKWNMNRREKERLILTNRLMRENSYLTRHHFKNIEDTFRTVLAAYVSFLDARCGILVEQHGNEQHIRATTDPNETKRLHNAVPPSLSSATRLTTDEEAGVAFFPISFEGFEGYAYVEGKNLVFPFQQLQPFLEILQETIQEVLTNASLHQRQTEETQLASVGLATSKIVSRVEESMARVTQNVDELQRDLAGAGEDPRCVNIRTAVNDVLRLTQEVHGFSDEQQRQLELSRHSIKELVTDAIQRFGDALAAANVEVETELDASLQAVCDRREIGRCLDALIQNSLDAFAAHQVEAPRLSLNASYLDDYHNAVQVVIRDNGGGIPSDLLGHVFEPFRSSTPDQRIGLGASLTKQILEHHNGKLAYESDEGRGATFRLVLPVSPEAPVKQTVSGKIA